MVWVIVTDSVGAMVRVSSLTLLGSADTVVIMFMVSPTQNPNSTGALEFGLEKKCRKLTFSG